MSPRIKTLEGIEDTIRRDIKDDNSKPYLVTTSFYSSSYEPDDVENGLIDRIRKFKNQTGSINIPVDLYNRLSNHRYGRQQKRQSHRYNNTLTPNMLESLWNEYDGLYGHIIQFLIDNANRNSKLHLHPRTYDFVDVNGSKHQNHILDENGTLHIHSIYLVRNEIQEEFERLIAQEFRQILWQPKLNGIRQVHAERIADGPDDLRNVLAYNSKFALGLGRSGDFAELPLFHMFPISSEERGHKRRVARQLAYEAVAVS